MGLRISTGIFPFPAFQTVGKEGVSRAEVTPLFTALISAGRISCRNLECSILSKITCKNSVGEGGVDKKTSAIFLINIIYACSKQCLILQGAACSKGSVTLNKIDLLWGKNKCMLILGSTVEHFKGSDV